MISVIRETFRQGKENCQLLVMGAPLYEQYGIAIINTTCWFLASSGLSRTINPLKLVQAASWAGCFEMCLRGLLKTRENRSKKAVLIFFCRFFLKKTAYF